MKEVQGIPVISVGCTHGVTPTVTIRISNDMKLQLDQVKHKLQRDKWGYISYNDVLSYLLQPQQQK